MNTSALNGQLLNGAHQQPVVIPIVWGEPESPCRVFFRPGVVTDFERPGVVTDFERGCDR